MNAVILSFDSNEKQSVICERKHFNYETMGAVESHSVKSARKAKGELHNCGVCVSVTQHLTFHVIIRTTNNTNLLSSR